MQSWRIAAKSFQSSLLSWYRANARQLPWRTTPSLYKTVVSEFMLQQTQVATVLPYFDRWLKAFPDFASLAAAPEDDVLRLWEGLGYYSRARNLHQLAREIARQARSYVTAADWQELPGVGPYTAAAISSIACGHPAACVDGNVIRILSRLTAEPTSFRDGSSAAKFFAPVAAELLNRDAPGDHNQAMMELGATVCSRANPKCDVCPVRAHCAARGPDATSYPRIATTKTELQSVTRVWCVRDGSLLLYRAPKSARRLAGQHEIPTAGHLGLSEARARRGPLLATKKRSITRYRITETIHLANVGSPPVSAELTWVPLKQLETITLSGPHRRWIGELLSRDQT